MNKGFTLAVLGVVLCAMGLIFFLQSGGETPSTTPVSQSPGAGGSFPNPSVNGTSVAEAPRMTNSPRPTPPTAVVPEGNSRPSAPAAGPTTQAPRVTPPTGDTGRAELPQVEPPRTDAPRVEPPKVEPPAVAPPRVDPPVVAPAKVEPPKVEAPAGPAKTEPAKTEPAKVEPSKAEPAKTEQPKTTPVREENLSLTAAHALRAIELRFSDRKMILRIEADGAFPIKSFFLPDPDRLVLDLPGKWTGMKAPTVPQNKIVKAARLGNQTTGPRLVLDLNGPLKNRSVQRINAGTVEITLE